jgi:hypothetical protein
VKHKVFEEGKQYSTTFGVLAYMKHILNLRLARNLEHQGTILCQIFVDRYASFIL